MAHRIFWLRSFVVVAAVAALGALVTRGPAQDVGKQIGGEVELKPGWDEHNQTYYTLLRGDKKLDKNQMLKVAQAVSKWWVFRLTFITYKKDPPRMARLVKEFDDEITYKVL